MKLLLDENTLHVQKNCIKLTTHSNFFLLEVWKPRNKYRLASKIGIQDN